ncbi:MAG TPA: sensor histidine kinase [Nocardioidaceae bacterium]|nr:sensor histidine kinase [Nocardioidaceae bacterium]
MDASSCAVEDTRTGFEHHAVFYSGLDGLVAAVVPFIEDGVDRGEQVLVALRHDALVAVEHALGGRAIRVDFVDMGELGANPACIIPEWRRFLEDAAGEGPVRGVGEPVWSGRRDVEMQEAVLHEALLNLAFDGGPAWQLLCPYDASALPPEVLAEAARTHPVATGATVAAAYSGPDEARVRFSSPLPSAPEDADAVAFGRGDLAGLRAVVARLAAQAGVGGGAADDLVLACHELATNSVVHGGGSGVLKAWTEPGAFVAEVSDAGVIRDPLVGRDLLQELAENGRGIWMANQLCDLVQVRSGEDGTVVRLFSWL